MNDGGARGAETGAAGAAASRSVDRGPATARVLARLVGLRTGALVLALPASADAVFFFGQLVPCFFAGADFFVATCFLPVASGFLSLVTTNSFPCECGRFTLLGQAQRTFRLRRRKLRFLEQVHREARWLEGLSDRAKSHIRLTLRNIVLASNTDLVIQVPQVAKDAFFRTLKKFAMARADAPRFSQIMKAVKRV
jgi:hypothetical protein